DGDITNQVKVLLGKVDPNKVGKYQLTYGVEDSKGNDAYKTITVEVIEEQAVTPVTPEEKPTKPEQKPAVESTGTQMTLLGVIAIMIMLILVTVRKRMRSR
ncbi:MAG: immunoglobulin-like domain-containing protein, partial [Mycoplasmatales bacterium]